MYLGDEDNKWSSDETRIISKSIYLKYFVLNKNII